MMNREEQTTPLPNNLKFLVGLKVKVDHPITCLNPTEYFEIFEAKINNKPREFALYIRGKDTCWFAADLILDKKL